LDGDIDDARIRNRLEIQSQTCEENVYARASGIKASLLAFGKYDSCCEGGDDEDDTITFTDAG
jgi:hypothetical protein